MLWYIVPFELDSNRNVRVPGPATAGRQQVLAELSTNSDPMRIINSSQLLWKSLKVNSYRRVTCKLFSGIQSTKQ